MIRKKINLGIIGGGFIVKNSHIPAYIVNNKIEQIFVAEPDLEKISNLSKEFPNIKTCTNYRDILANDRIDFVLIATPMSTHYQLSMEALTSGKNILCQKPFCGDIHQANLICEMAKRSNLKVAVCDSFRWYPSYMKTKKLLDDGLIGDLFYTSFNDHYYADYRDHEQFFDKFLLLRNSIHKIDLFRYWFGDNILELEAKICNEPHQKLLGETLVLMTLKYDKNHFLQLVDNGAATSPGYRMITISGSKGSIHCDDEKVELFIKLPNRKGIWKNHKIKRNRVEFAFNSTLNELIDAVKKNRQPSNSGDDYIKTLKLVNSAYASSKSKKTLLFNEGEAL